MNAIIIKIIFFSYFLIFIIGCQTYDIAVQDSNLKGPPSRNTIKITENRDKNLEVHAAFSSNDQGIKETNTGDHTFVNSNGIYEVENADGNYYKIERNGVNNIQFKGNNFHWTLPSYQGMLDFDVATSSNFSLNGGISLSAIEGKLYWSKNFGLAFFNQGENTAWRFDAGVKFQEMQINVDYVLIENDDYGPYETRRVYFLNKQEKKDQNNMYFSFTFNSLNQEWPFNYFFSYTLGWQTFYDFEGSSTIPQIQTLEDVYYSENYHTLSLGFYKTILNMGRIIVGGRISAYTDEEGQMFIPDFFIQYDFLFF